MHLWYTYKLASYYEYVNSIVVYNTWKRAVTKVVAGMTLMYMAPELFRYILCKKADVYGVALVMYYLIYGKPMWPDASMIGKNVLKFVSADIFEYFCQSYHFVPDS